MLSCAQIPPSPFNACQVGYPSLGAKYEFQYSENGLLDGYDDGDEWDHCVTRMTEMQ